jgi:hypothetical protein
MKTTTNFSANASKKQELLVAAALGKVFSSMKTVKTISLPVRK